MSFEDSKPGFNYDQDDLLDGVEVSGQPLEIQKEEKEKRLFRDLKRFFPSVLEQSTAATSDKSSEIEIDRIRRQAREKLNSKLANSDVDKSTNEQPNYPGEYKEYDPLGTHETLAPLDGGTAQTNRGPQVVGSVLASADYADKARGQNTTKANGKLKLDSAVPATPANQPKGNYIQLALTIGFIAAFLVLLLIFIIFLG